MSDREHKRSITRSISLPVQACLSMPSWKEFMQLLHASWRESTMLANWAAHTLVLCDVVRTPAMMQLPKYQVVDLYALAFGRDREKLQRRRLGCPECQQSWWPSQVNDVALPHGGGAGCSGVGQPLVERPRGSLPVQPIEYEAAGFWGGAKSSAQSILKKVQRKYLQERGKVLWRRERRTPEFLYPYPFPVHQDSWVGFWDDASNRHQPCIRIGLPGGKVTLRLRNGPEFASQLCIFGEIMDSTLRQQELWLTRQSAHSHFRQDIERSPGGDHRSFYRVMVRIAYSREVKDAGLDGVADLRTGREPFLSLTIPGSHQWNLYAPWVRQWIVAHAEFRRKFADDLKYEKRWPRGRRKRFLRRQSQACNKHARRMKTFLQQTAAQVIGYCLRKKIGLVRYDNSNRDFAQLFPWFTLEGCIQDKCDEAGIVLESASGVTPNEEDEVISAVTD